MLSVTRFEIRATYSGHQDGSLVHFMPRIFKVADLLVHAVDNFEVRLLFAFIEALQVRRLTRALLGCKQTLVFRANRRLGPTFGLSFLRVFGRACLVHRAHGGPIRHRGIVTDDDLASRAASLPGIRVFHGALSHSSL